jgi:hypothetical protein
MPKVEVFDERNMNLVDSALYCTRSKNPQRLLISGRVFDGSEQILHVQGKRPIAAQLGDHTMEDHFVIKELRALGAHALFVDPS